MLTRVLGLITGIAALAALSSIASASSGLTIGLAGGPGRAPEVLPGDYYTQTVLVTGGDTDRDVLVEVLGYKEDLENGLVPLNTSEDVEAYSARPFITPAEAKVHVPAGETKRVDLDVSIPESVGDGGRYALLRFSTDSQVKSTVGVVSAIVLPFKFTIKNSELIHTGKIAGFAMQNPKTGEPLAGSITYENTGNHHYTISGEIEIKRAGGTLVGTVLVKSASPIPGSATRIPVNWTPTSSLSPGFYSTEATLTLEDGTVLDQGSSSFEILDNYVPPSPPSSVPNTSNDNVSPSQSSGTNWLPMIALGVGAFVLGSGGTLLANRRRRQRR